MATLELTDPAELNLAKQLCQFAEIIPQVLNGFRPNILANYLFELANSFHAFYEACPVLKSEEPARSSRLALCDLRGGFCSAAGSFGDQSAGEDVTHEVESVIPSERRTRIWRIAREEVSRKGFLASLGMTEAVTRAAPAHPNLHVPIAI